MSLNFLKAMHNNSSTGVAYKNIILKKTILSFFATKGRATISDISHVLNTSIPKINECIIDLIEEKLVRDYGKSEAGVGRRPYIYGLNPSSAFFIGVQVSNEYLNMGLMNFGKEMVYQKENIPFQLVNNQDSLSTLCSEIKNFIRKSHIQSDKIMGLGINLSGRINHKPGYSYSYFNFFEEPLSKVIEDQLGIFTFIENDSRAMAYGEFTNGVVRNEKHALFLNLDYGVGLGIMIDGQLYYGKSGFAGEFGHMPLFDNEIICRCGKKGCLETVASGNALRRRAIEELANGASSILSNKYNDNKSLTLRDILKAALNDDNLSIELINEVGHNLGRGIASLINLFNPELVVIGGVLAEAGEYLSLPIRNAINRYTLSLVNQDSRIAFSSLGEKAAVIGACQLLRDRILGIIE